MPNHVHGILIVNNTNIDVETLHCNVLMNDEMALQLNDRKTLQCNVCTENGIKNEQMAKISPKPRSISTILRSYKSVVTKHAHYIEPDFSWQERFHDHIIQKLDSFERIQNYIENNIANWKEDKFHN